MTNTLHLEQSIARKYKDFFFIRKPVKNEKLFFLQALNQREWCEKVLRSSKNITEGENILDFTEKLLLYHRQPQAKFKCVCCG